MMRENISSTACKKPCYIDSICTRCDFFDGTDDDLECAAYKILIELVKKEVISIRDIENAKIECKKING